MSTQVINLNNVDSVVFGNKEVETLILNGVQIWIGISQLDKLIDRSIESVSSEDLEGITEIGENAFRDCTQLNSITIPNSVTSIGDYAFSGCTNLTTMRLLPTTPPTLGSSSAISSATTRIEVPKNSLSDYQTAENWSAYADIIVGV